MTKSEKKLNLKTTGQPRTLEQQDLHVNIHASKGLRTQQFFQTYNFFLT